MALLPSYRYTPDETGLFRSYLTGVLRNKALMAIRAEARRARREGNAAQEARSGGMDRPEGKSGADEERDFRHSAYELALREFFADKSVMPRTKEIFRRVALGGESPATLGDLIADDRARLPDEVLADRQLRDELFRHLGDLDDRARLVLTRRFGLDGKPPALLDAIGRELGVSRERARQLQEQALHKLREFLLADFGAPAAPPSPQAPAPTKEPT